MSAKYRRKFTFYENEHVSITVIDYGGVVEKCQYCSHKLRYHYVVDDKKTGQKGRMKVGCECVKFFMKEIGMDDLMIERADKVIKKQMAALNHVRRFENLDVDKLYDVMSDVITFGSYGVRNTIDKMVQEKMKEKYGETNRYGMWNERQEVRKVINESVAVKSLREMRTTPKVVESHRLWDRKYNGKFRGLGDIYWRYCRDASSFSKGTLEDYRKKMVEFYLTPVKSPYYFG